VAVYTHRDPVKLLASWQGKTIHRADQIRVRSFDPHFIDSVAERLGRRNNLTVSVTEGMLFIEVDGVSLHTEIHEHQIT
jgi:uncharacterized protein YaeQ